MPEIFNDLKKINRILSRKDRIRFVLLFCLMLAGSVLEAVGVGLIPAFMAFVMSPASVADHGWIPRFALPVALPEKITRDLLLIASLVLVIFTILKNSFLAFVFYSQSRLVNSLRVMLADRMFRVYQKAPYEWHLARNSAEILRNIRDDTGQVLNNVVMAVLDIILALMMTIMVIAVLLFTVTGASLLGMAIMGFGLVSVVTFFKKQIRNAGHVQRRETAESVKAVQQGFGALVDARINQREAFLANTFRASMVRQGRAARLQATIQKVTPYAIETCAIIGVLIVVVSIVMANDSFESAIPALALFIMVALRLKQATTQIANSYHKINGSRSFVDGIVADIEELERLDTARFSNVAGHLPLGNFRELKLDAVSYRYPDAETDALSGISLTIIAGQSVAFVGKTGCGKSTLMNMILGLLVPRSGSITVNGQNMGDHLQDWWRHIGYIPQHIFLLDDSIRANVAFALPPEQVDEGRIWEVLRLARLDDYVISQPDGLDTRVGERGVRLSGGQRQRLGIARALYNDPEILLMDEATSALDNHTETQVMAAINDMKQGRTLIMIAHRLSTVMACEKIYYLAKGSLKASGSYTDLLEKSVEFKTMAINS